MLFVLLSLSETEIRKITGKQESVPA